MKTGSFTLLVKLHSTKYLIQLINFFRDIFGLFLMNFYISEHKMKVYELHVNYVIM